MKKMQLSTMTKGWFVGDFSPTVLATTSCEVACKFYRAGDSEGRHVHKVATEVTLIVSGSVTMNGDVIRGGEIVLLEPGAASDFVALEDTVTMVVKVPCFKGDKYSA